jgi:hypothetical protein
LFVTIGGQSFDGGCADGLILEQRMQHRRQVSRLLRKEQLQSSQAIFSCLPGIDELLAEPGENGCVIELDSERFYLL